MSRSQLGRIWLLTTAVVLVAGCLWGFVLFGNEPHSLDVALPLAAFAALVALFDSQWLTLSLNVRGRDASYVFVEIPVVLGVLFVDPSFAPPAMAVASFAAHRFHQHGSTIKAAFNASNAALRFSLCWSIVAVAGGVDPLSPKGWLLVGGASTLTSLLSDAVSGAVAAIATEQKLVPTIVAATTHSHFISFTATAQGLMLGVMMDYDPLSVLLYVASTSVFFIGSQAYAHQHTQRTTAEERALTDPLTGVANRAALDRALEQDGRFGLIYIDLDNFKAVNDRYGHGAGDRVIIETAQRLREAVRGGDLVARVGGDEFVVLLQPGSDLAEVAGRIENILAADFTHEGVVLPTGASIGAVEREPGEAKEQLVVRADQAMYAVKATRHRARRDGERERR